MEWEERRAGNSDEGIVQEVPGRSPRRETQCAEPQNHMTNDHYITTDPDWEWLGPDPSQMDEEPNEFDELARVLHQHAKALAELQKALQKVRAIVFQQT